MSKRKAPESATKPIEKMDVDNEDDSGSDNDEDMLNVDFEWFPPNTDVDFHGLKTLLRQLFDVDNQLHDLSALTDLILSQSHIGSTVKCDGEESDPYAFLTALPFSHLKSRHHVLQTLSTWILERAGSSSSTSKLTETLSPLLAADSKANIGLVLTERFINMPHQIIPPLYTMLQSELTSAISNQEPQYKFTHYLFLSKTYTEVASQLDAEDSQPTKKSKKAAAAKAEVFYFHPEDEVLRKHAVVSGGFEYEKQGEDGASDAKRAFQEMGVRPEGLFMLVEAGKFEKAVEGVVEYLSGE
jgi:protein BCP1